MTFNFRLCFLLFQNESVQTKTVEISNLRDKITSLEATLSSVAEEKVQNEVSAVNHKLIKSLTIVVTLCYHVMFCF